LKIWMLRWILIVLRKLLERISKFQAESGFIELKKHKPYFYEGCSETLD
jgi:hypothetical protein